MTKSSLADRELMKSLRDKGVVPLSHFAVRSLVAAIVIGSGIILLGGVAKPVELRKWLEAESLTRNSALLLLQAALAPLLFITVLVALTVLGASIAQTRLLPKAKFLRRGFASKRERTPIARAFWGLMLGCVGGLLLGYVFFDEWLKVVRTEREFLAPNIATILRALAAYVAITLLGLGLLLAVLYRVVFRWRHGRGSKGRPTRH